MSDATALESSPASRVLEPEDELRAATFSLLARLCASAPDAPLLEQLSGVSVTADTAQDDLARAWAELGERARRADLAALDDDYHRLFIGIGQGELTPYGSWYLTGFLMERPLAAIRSRLADLGLERGPENKEPEDHVAALCEVMALLIRDPDYGPAEQQRFFSEHLDTWVLRFFDDLERAGSADFYKAVGRLGSEFMALERRCLSMIA